MFWRWGDLVWHEERVFYCLGTFVGGGDLPTCFEHHHLQPPCALIYNRHQVRAYA